MLFVGAFQVGMVLWEFGTLGVVLQIDGSIRRDQVKSGRKKDGIDNI